jgi:F420-non-reducing hydrogenase iron-sulfur subunit
MPDVKTAFEPEITAFVCQYCGDMAADSAGTMHAAYPANIKIVRLPCTGKLDLLHILNAFEYGADGVYIVACPLGNCHHIDGNRAAVRRVAYAKTLLDELKLGAGRLDLFHITAAQGDQFARIATEMTERIRALGPNPLRKL